jgi:signal peptidase
MSSSSQHRRPPRRVARRAGAVVVNGLLLVATVAGLAYLAPSLLGYERYVITGGSMAGTIDKGSIVLEKDVPVAHLAVGDVITYLPPADSGVTNLVTHRIVEAGTSDTGARLFRTQGDANPEPDPWTFSLAAGEQPVVRHHVPHVGWVMVALADRDVRVLVVGIPAGLIALLSALELVRALRDGRRGRRDDLVPAPPVLVGRRHPGPALHPPALPSAALVAAPAVDPARS